MTRTPYIADGAEMEPRGYARAGGTFYNLDPNAVEPLHGVRDRAKLDELVEGLRLKGWTGRPLLVHRVGRMFEAWCGSHRVAAARVAGVRILAYCVNPDGEPLGVDGPRTVIRNADRLKILEAYGDTYAADLMRAEIDGR